MGGWAGAWPHYFLSPTPLLCQLAGGGLQLATLTLGKSNFQFPPAKLLWAVASGQFRELRPTLRASQRRLEEQPAAQGVRVGGGDRLRSGDPEGVVSGVTHLPPLRQEHLALGQERMKPASWESGDLSGSDFGVSRRGRCWDGLWKASSGEDSDVRGCEGLPGHGWTWGLGTETQGEPHGTVVPMGFLPPWAPSEETGWQRQSQWGAIWGFGAKHYENIGKFSHKSEANETEAIIH